MMATITNCCSRSVMRLAWQRVSVGVVVCCQQPPKQQQQQQLEVRCLTFSFAGPKTLNDVLKKELVQDKSGTDVKDMWFTYHETKDDAVGLVLNGQDGKAVLSRATSCPFFIQPVFRDDGFFTLVSQFQGPCHFLLAYLEDYKMDPHACSPLLSFSVFDDYSDSKDLTLVRCDVINKSIEKDEARKVAQSLIDNYRMTEEFNGAVKVFNQRPSAFDVDDHISRMNKRWNEDRSSSDSVSSSSP